jgi:imidazolonepropionase-like amidohydrolase
MDREVLLTNQTVLISNGRITAIGSNLQPPQGVEIIEGRGKYLIPGLTDMHVHLLSDTDDYPDTIAEDELKVMIANGVTTVRFMIGTPEQLILRDKAARGAIISPTIYAASPHLTGKEQGNDFVVATEAQARDAVRKSKEAGYDFIKVTTFLEPNVYEAIVAQAAQLQIPVVGHADSRYVGLDRALESGQQIEHLDGYMESLLQPDAPMDGSVSDLYIYSPENWESLDYLDLSRIKALAERTVAANPFVNPTQHFMKNTFGKPRSEASIRDQPDFKFYPKEVQDFYIGYMKKMRLNEVPQEKKDRWVAIRDSLIRAIHDAGGKIMAGSDTPEFLWLYGYSLHRELRALREAGLTNYAVLEAATRNPAMFLGTIDESGTIEKGKRADLILLNGNPLENISNTSNRAGVMIGGKYYLQSLLDTWSQTIAPKIASSYKKKEK